jgi:hypothetical protein
MNYALFSVKIDQNRWEFVAITAEDIELMNMIKKGQMVSGDRLALSFAGQYYLLAD